MDKLVEKTKCNLKSNFKITDEMSEKIYIIPPNRTRYLSEISEASRNYDKAVETQSLIAVKLQSIRNTIETLKDSKIEDKDRIIKTLKEQEELIRLDLDPRNLKTLESFDEKKKRYIDDYYIFKVRDKEI